MSDLSAPRHKLHWLPNALTVSRIILIPVLVWGIIYPFIISYEIGLTVEPILAWLVVALFALCMITDFLDGYWARKWNIASDFGRMLDPIADKLLVAASLIAICITNSGAALIVVPVLTIIGRDIFVSGIREHAANANLILAPTKLAKWKTMFEMLAILLCLLATALPQDPTLDLPKAGGWVMYPPLDQNILSPNPELFTAFLAFLWLAAILSAYTGFHYFRSAMRKAG